MPNIITHKIFGEDVLKLASRDIKDYVAKNPQAFSVGTSGPDFLFYNGVLPWQDLKQGQKVRDIGGLLHSENINDWYRVAINSCIIEKDPILKADMISFMIGHLTHWALDSRVHPFIFYRTDGSNRDSAYWHFRYESMLDTVMVHKYRKQSITAYPSKEILKTDKAIEKAIYKVYKDAIEKNYDVEFKEKYVEESFDHLQTILNLLHDPSGIKFKILRVIETIIRKKWLFTSHVVTDKINEEIDVLNTNHHTWKNPAKPSFSSNESFLDLYYKAIDLTVNVLSEFEEVLSGKPIDKLLDLIDNKSYETGLSNKKPMLEFKSVY